MPKSFTLVENRDAVTFSYQKSGLKKYPHNLHIRDLLSSNSIVHKLTTDEIKQLAVWFASIVKEIEKGE